MKKALFLSLVSVFFMSAASAELAGVDYVRSFVASRTRLNNVGDNFSSDSAYRTGEVVKGLFNVGADGFDLVSGKITDSEIENGTISQAKIKDLETDLNAKQDNLTADNGVTIVDNKVSGVAATTTSYGVVKYGAIPTSSTGTGEASIWVE